MSYTTPPGSISQPERRWVYAGRIWRTLARDLVREIKAMGRGVQHYIPLGSR